MAEGNLIVIPSDVNLLRNKMESQMEFKKKLIGGFDEKDVANYFKCIDEQLQKTEETFKVRIDEIEASKRKLQDELNAHKDKFSKAVATAEELKRVIKRLEKEKVELQEELENAANNMSEPQLVRERDDLTNRVLELEQEILQVRESGKLDDELKASYEFKIANLEEEVSTLKEVNSQLEQRIGIGNNGLALWMSGIKNDMELLYKQLADLEEMSNVNEQLKQQLIQETLRAEKAEKDLAEFGQLVFELQNRILTKV